jgi:hypothetical protein
VAGTPAGDDIVDAVLTASRTLVAVTEQSLGTVAEDTTIAQYRALVVLASRGPGLVARGRPLQPWHSEGPIGLDQWLAQYWHYARIFLCAFVVPAGGPADGAAVDG